MLPVALEISDGAKFFGQKRFDLFLLVDLHRDNLFR